MRLICFSGIRKQVIFSSNMESLISKGPFVALWISFTAGVGTSLTPCIYPLIPVIVGIIGGESEKKLKAFTLSLLYVLGLAAVYAFLGIIASIGGRVFGLTAHDPLVNIFVGVLVIIFGLSMLDIISLPLTGSAVDPSRFRSNWYGVMLLGMVSGFVAAPCSTPVLGSILAYAALSKSTLFGALLLFVYGFGSGAILIAAGTFAGIAANLPKSGSWMIKIKKTFGIIMLLAGLYFILRTLI